MTQEELDNEFLTSALNQKVHNDKKTQIKTYFIINGVKYDDSLFEKIMKMKAFL